MLTTMKQVRFDTPRRSDTRLHSYRDLACESLDCQEPRPLVGPCVLPTAAILPRFPIDHPPICSNSSETCGGSRVSFRPVPPGVSKTVFSNAEKRLSEPSVDLELSSVDASLIGDTRRHSADSHALRPMNLNNSSNISNLLPKTLKRAEYADLQKVEIDPRFKRSGGVENGGMLLSKQQINASTVPNWTSSKPVLQMENPMKTKLKTPSIMYTSRNTEMPKHCSHNRVPIYNKENSCPHPAVHTHAQIHRTRHFASPCCNPSQSLEEDILEPSLYSPWKEQPPSCHHQQTVQCHAHRSHSNGARLSPKKFNRRESFTKPCCPPHPDTTANSAGPKLDAIEKYNESQNKATSNSELEKQTNISNEHREPTVSDLFKIIQIQNEQLKLLQERVDKLLLTSQATSMDTSTPFRPVQNFIQERVSVETVDENRHKISIGVMTSFEVRTNKERTARTSQMQCNRSQVSIREVISNTGEGNLNFLDGIAPVDQNNVCDDASISEEPSYRAPDYILTLDNEEKTMNELSLCNLQLDNATTPQLSPDQTIYLDVKDYSDSEDDQESGVGWTYYNKVMNHVNEILQESAVPSSAGALHRRAVAAAAGPGCGGGGDGEGGGAPRCTRLHVDRTDLSITTSKRVRFGGPLPTEAHKQFAQPVSSDTSIQMNRLAAKYLSHRPAKSKRPVPKARDAPLDMSLATRRYMEQHNLIEDGVPTPAPVPGVPTKFLDITALKQQPKLM